MRTALPYLRFATRSLIAAALLGSAALFAPQQSAGPIWVSNPKRAASEPSACFDQSGRLWTFWISCNRSKQATARIDGACLLDGQVLAKFEMTDLGVLPAAPHAVATDDGVYLVFESGGDGERRLFGRELDWKPGQSNVELGELESIPTTGGTPLVPRLAMGSDGLALVYQGLNGANYDLFYCQRGAQGWSEARALTETACDEWNPKLVADPTGGLHLAWDFYTGTSFDVAYAQIENGQLVRQQIVAGGENYQGFPELAVDDQNAIWISWEESSQFGKFGGLRAERKLGLAKLESVQGDSRASIQRLASDALPAEIKRREFPRPTLTKAGLFLTYNSPVRANRKRDHLFTSWMTSVIGFGADGPSEQRIPKSDGNCDADTVLLADKQGKLTLVFVADRRSEQFARVSAWSDSIERRPHLAVVSIDAQAGFPEMQTSAAPSNGELSSPSSLTTPTQTMPGVVFGDLHRHTHLSRCSGAKDGTLLDAYRYARGPGGLGFVAITDHFQHMRTWSWFRSRRDAIRYHAPGSLVVLLGVERVRAKRGHYNDIYFDPEDVPFDTETWMKAPSRFAPTAPEKVIAIPHMMSIDDGTGFNWDEFEEDRTRLFEIYQGKRGSFEGHGLPYESDDGVQRDIALARGFERGDHFGLIASSDHVSSSTSFAGLHVEALTRAAVFGALRERHCFATTVPRALETSLGQLVMGQAGDPGSGARFSIELPKDNAEQLAYIELVKNGVTKERLASQSEHENWIVTLRRVPLSSQGGLTIRIEGGSFRAAKSRRPGSPGLRIEQLQERLVSLRRTEFIQIDMQLEIHWNASAAVQQLLFQTGATEVKVPRRSVELGKSLGISEGGLVALAWRQGTPLNLAESRVSFDIDVLDGDSYYSRIAWTDGNLAWTSPIRIRLDDTGQ